MVAHTGFLLVTRKLADGVTSLALKRRPSKTEFSQQDLDAWTPSSVGERAVSDKKLRRAARDAVATTQTRGHVAPAVDENTAGGTADETADDGSVEN